jgi:hypothetical protein
MKGNREAHFSGVFAQLGWATWLGKVQVTYGILENFGISKLHNHSSYLLSLAISAIYNI